MNAVALVVLTLALASSVFAGCSGSGATACEAAFDNCTNFGTVTPPTCECSITYRNCMNSASCCSTTNTSDDCDTKCNANCGVASCAWPPPLDDNCAQRSTCHALYNCAVNNNCRCHVSLRQCLLFQGCSYNSSLSSSCSSSCSSRNPSPDCSAKAATILPSPSVPAGCTAAAGYVQAGDCSCRDDIRGVAPTATCATGAWAVTGPFTLSGNTISLQYDTVNINGDFTVTNSGTLAFTVATNTDAARVVVDGTATIQGSVRIELTNADTAQKTLTLLTATSVSVPSPLTSLLIPTLTSPLCFVSRGYNTPSTDITFTYQVSSVQSECTSTQSPTLPPSVTTGVANRPSPVIYTPPPKDDSVSTLSVFASVVLLAASLLAKYL